MIKLMACLYPHKFVPPKGKPAPRKMPESDEAGHHQAYGNRIRREILMYLAHGDMTTGQIADFMCTSNQGARNQLKNLEAEGKVEIVSGTKGAACTWRSTGRN